MRLHRSAAHAGVEIASGPVLGQICSDAIFLPAQKCKFEPATDAKDGASAAPNCLDDPAVYGIACKSLIKSLLMRRRCASDKSKFDPVSAHILHNLNTAVLKLKLALGSRS
jgi:hypothetical protein